ncbi:hypothetical protein CLOLEP_03638 [[Clostridium] leptum DSM 753]|uniref:Uncharacterized protein n=1 Tax=[Clostridium] leptum DSM 753 TaxID=428125 RepID=A7VYG0_9FIRM|nr:hypothetical protein CLOLEP_03638 [[Clostridium] leptum DSM 753]
MEKTVSFPKPLKNHPVVKTSGWAGGFSKSLKKRLHAARLKYCFLIRCQIP